MFAHIEPILAALASFAKGYATGAAVASAVFIGATCIVVILAVLQAVNSGAWIVTAIAAGLFVLISVPLFVLAALTFPAFLAAAALVDRQRFATTVVQTVETEVLNAPEAGQPLVIDRDEVARFRQGFDQLGQQVAAKAPWGVRAITAWVARRTIGLIGDAAATAVLAEFKTDGTCSLPGSIAQFCGRFIDRATASSLRASYWKGTALAVAVWVLAASATLIVPTTVSAR